jgi:hypothetical protein
MCTAGSYCETRTTTPVICQPGSYCPSGTEYSTEFLCPNGTFSASHSLQNITQCTPCTPGYYCGEPGITAPTAKCREGYFCGGGSSVATPHESGASGIQISYTGETCVKNLNSTINDICPPGHYCPEGSDSPVQCPPGTNSSSTGLATIDDCPQCSRGYLCPHNATVHATQLCADGYFCPTGTYVLSDDLICPTGSMCPEGSGEPTICSAGYYQDEVGQNYCKVRDPCCFVSVVAVSHREFTATDLSHWILLRAQYHHACRLSPGQLLSGAHPLFYRVSVPQWHV